MSEFPLVLERRSSCVVAHLHGDLDIANIEPVRTAILDATADDTYGVVVDLAEVRYIDSAGVHMLFELLRQLEGKRQRMAITVPDGSPIGTLLKITNVNEAVPVCTTIEACAEALTDDVGLY